MNIVKLSIVSMTAVLLLGFTSCKKEDSDPTSETAAKNPLEAYYREVVPAGARHISEVFSSKPGDEVVLHGEVMGRLQPFVEGRSMVMLGDPTTITPCNRIPGDQCQTPWDVCCDDPEVIKKSIATIQFLDSDGKVLKHNIKGFKGIKELSFITVKGTIAEGSNADNLLINAQVFHVTDPSPYIDAPPVADYSHHGHLEQGVITEEEDGTIIFKRHPVPMESKTENSE